MNKWSDAVTYPKYFWQATLSRPSLVFNDEPSFFWESLMMWWVVIVNLPGDVYQQQLLDQLLLRRITIMEEWKKALWIVSTEHQSPHFHARGFDEKALL